MAAVAGVSLGCSPNPPLRLGFLGTLTGRAADLGVAGRDGALFAVEQARADTRAHPGGVVFTPVDDRAAPTQVGAWATAVEQAQLDILIGPMTSAVATSWVPVANRLALLTISPTVTSPAFSGLDDYFCTATSNATVYARHNATYCVQQLGLRRFALLSDRNNAAYTEPWCQTFAETAQRLGAEPVDPLAYSGGSLSELSRMLAAALSQQPQALVLCASAPDVAYSAQALRRRGQTLRLVAAEWAGSEEVRLQGGAAVNGLVFSQFHNPLDTSLRYATFQANFRQRFGRSPGFAEAAAFDATQVAIRVLRERMLQESPKAALLRIGTFEGLQHPIVFNATGDTQRPVHMVMIEDGALRLLS